ncbi:bifunctional phosphoribosyl-AMP cyclohydrolase/phosphoribosyl-ATP diphosphatase HisIE [Chryseotalea sanaruensis]|uniref:Histidine biosynthesis bifunctional protein HisIE n=1 Tax=Chryseotalea sanaruensis TaxID=2482724 RepID=A0A401U9C6_9BACT|nr:bifunctional phosphoribosyl-AMP cyclohydrolase/phosphoribosyl-ATP diphosphatase HisIE [Chryseotalea sanaruensis]GCC51491.1 bifunctional phosphoribosyl-AMP cyclohydrolase/phosphoribosyl-ATP diphosphatase HisIE [Chryseotalea sanaruensis]
MEKLTIDFSKNDGLVPCIVQDANTQVVLMLGYMNEEAYTKTLQEKRVTFYSRSKKRLWTKGETTQHYLNLVSIAIDCDQDTLLIKAIPQGPTCHTGADTCFNEVNRKNWSIHSLEEIVQERKSNPTASSYTNKLLASGINKVAQKVGEEAVELVIESKDDNQELFLGEAADLMYHYLVLLAAKGFTLSDVENVLEKRHAKAS